MTMPHRIDSAQPPAPIETQIELESPPIAAPAARAPLAPARPSGGGDATLWILTGLASLSLGVALATTPNVSWTAGKIAARLAELGVHSGVAVIGGILLMVLGLVRRGQHIASAEMQYDSSLMFEQVAAQLAELRATLENARMRDEASARSVDDLRAHLAQTRDALALQIEQLAAHQTSDALFQLASGLDKLGLRFEQRMRMHHGALQDSFDELSATVEHSRRSLEELLHARSQAPNELAPVAPLGSTPIDPAPHGVAPPAEPLAELSHPRAQVEGSLGLLDQFEDVAPALPGAQAAQPEVEPEFGVGGAGVQGELERAARNVRLDSTWDEQLMVESKQDLDTKTKLLQLESLLSDERLRAALEAMRRQA